MYISEADQLSHINRDLYFSAVPLATANAVGSFTLNASGSYSIDMDDDGDGTTDEVIKPSAVLEGNDITDTVPPVTTATVDGTTVQLTATDDQSGVLNTKYSLDGVHWNVYTAPFDAQSGATVYFVSLDNAGNTEDIKTVVIPGNNSSDTNDTTTSGDSDSDNETTDSSTTTDSDTQQSPQANPVSITTVNNENTYYEAPTQPNDTDTENTTPSNTTEPPVTTSHDLHDTSSNDDTVHTAIHDTKHKPYTVGKRPAFCCLG